MIILSVDDNGGKSPTENSMNLSFSVAGGIATKKSPGNREGMFREFLNFKPFKIVLEKQNK